MRWSLIAAVNDEEVLQRSLLRSPDLEDATDVIFKRGFARVGAAYNAALTEARGDLLIFAHQDVYLPPGWIGTLENCVRQVNAMNPRWGVLGVIGMDLGGVVQGQVYSTGLKRMVGQPSDEPVPAQSVDEMVIILRRESGLRFDPQLPGYHLYGTDVCLQAWQRGLPCFVVTDFCLHNSRGIRRLPLAFWRSCLYLRSKWCDQLPLTTPCVTIRGGMFWPALALLDGLRNRRTPGARADDPDRLFSELCRTGQVESASGMKSCVG